MSYPNLIGILGGFGSGKSLRMVELGLELANRYRKPLVANFPLDDSACRRYCRSMGYRWFAACGRIIRIDLDLQDPSSLMLLFKYRHSVVLFDEAGVFASSRRWDKLPKEFGRNLFQIRHLDIHMILAFQFLEQIDKYFRETIQYWIWCHGISIYDRRLQAPRLDFRFAFHYNLDRFLMLADSPELRAKFIYPWRTAKKVDWRFVPIAWFFRELLNLFIVLFCQLRARPYPPLYSSRESLLFQCYRSINILGISLPRGSSRTIYVSGPHLDCPYNLSEKCLDTDKV